MNSLEHLFVAVVAQRVEYECQLLIPERLLISPELYIDLKDSTRVMQSLFLKAGVIDDMSYETFSGLLLGVDVRLHGLEFKIIIAET
jgi:hypothetical protein